MQFVEPQYPRDEVNRAAKRLVASLSGQRLLTPAESAPVWVVVNNWRAAHLYPAQSVYVTLARRAKKLDRNAFATQRNKRIGSIVRKLRDQPNMSLTQMQDVGGCRVVLPNIHVLEKFLATLPKSFPRHEFVSTKDYIAQPKDDGYRSVHLKLKYNGAASKTVYDGLKVEIQVRTQDQHKWATGLETVDTFTGQDIKNGNGAPHWRRFFALMSSWYAIREGRPTVPGTPTTAAGLRDELRDITNSHRIFETLNAIGRASKTVVRSVEHATYFLLELEPQVHLPGSPTYVTTVAYGQGEEERAHRDYADAEAKNADNSKQIVLVSAVTVKQLKRAYPNYFLDIDDFVFDVGSATI